MIRRDIGEASVARMLADLAPFQRWENRPLPRQVRQYLHELDEQTLMSLAAHVLRELIADEGSDEMGPGGGGRRRIR